MNSTTPKAESQLSISKTMVIGDLHGRFDRLERVLSHEGVIAPCALCAGTGEWDDEKFCSSCHGLGQTRVDRDTEVVQVGDLGDLRVSTQTQDSMCWAAVEAGWIDIVLIGNHEAPVFGGPTFSGFARPLEDTRQTMHTLLEEGRLKLAHAAYGYLITHAGMPITFSQTRTGSLKKTDPEKVARWINRKHEDRSWRLRDSQTWDLRDDIGPMRGGWNSCGGLLWRHDGHDPIYTGLKQVYGHTSDESIRWGPQADMLPYHAINVDISKHGGVGYFVLPEKRSVVLIDD